MIIQKHVLLLGFSSFEVVGHEQLRTKHLHCERDKNIRACIERGVTNIECK